MPHSTPKSDWVTNPRAPVYQDFDNIGQEFATATQDKDMALYNINNCGNINLGVGKIISGSSLVATPIDFSISPAVTVTSGSAITVSFSSGMPCPLGVNGADVNHYVRITDGTNSDVLLITGGTAVSGGTSGTITLAAPSHSYASGTWFMTSATAGIQEAVNKALQGDEIYIPATLGGVGVGLKVYASTYITKPLRIRGAGIHGTWIIPQSLTQNVFDINLPDATGWGTPMIIQDMGFASTATNQTGGTFITLTGGSSTFNSYSQFLRLHMEGPYFGIHCTNCNSWRVAQSIFHQCHPVGTYVLGENPANNDSGDMEINDNNFYGGVGSFQVAVAFKSGGGIRITDNKFLANGVDVWMVPATSSQIFQVQITRNIFDMGANQTNCAIYISDDNSGGQVIGLSIQNNYFGVGAPGQGFIVLNKNVGVYMQNLVITGNQMQLSAAATTFAVYCNGGVNVLFSGNELLSDSLTAAPLSFIGMQYSHVQGNLFGINSRGGFPAGSNSIGDCLFRDNVGIDDVVATVSTAATVYLPPNPNIVLNGTGTITSIIPYTTTPGQGGHFLPNAAVTATAGANIGVSISMSAGNSYSWWFDGVKTWIK